MNDRPTRISIAGLVVWGLLSFWAYTAVFLLKCFGASARIVRVTTSLFIASGVVVLAIFIFYIWFAVIEPGNEVVIYVGFAALLFLAGVVLLGVELFRIMKQEEEAGSHDAGQLNARWETLNLRIYFFFVMSLIFCSTPVIAAWRLVSQGNSSEAWLFYVLTFAAAAILHLWGTRLLVNTANDHLQFQRNAGFENAHEKSAAGTSGYDVFISYRREGGAETARLIRIALQQRGFRVFLDVDDLPSGHFDEGLLKMIRHTPGFVVILSRGALQARQGGTDWLRREVSEALQTGRNIVPVTLEGFSFDDLDQTLAELGRHNAVAYHHAYFDASMEQLTKQLRSRSG